MTAAFLQEFESAADNNDDCSPTPRHPASIWICSTMLVLRETQGLPRPYMPKTGVQGDISAVSFRHQGTHRRDFPNRLWESSYIIRRV